MLALCGVHASQLEMAGTGMSKGWISQPVLFLVLTKVLRLLTSDLFFKNHYGVCLAGVGENSYWLPKMHGELMSCANGSLLHTAY